MFIDLSGKILIFPTGKNQKRIWKFVLQCTHVEQVSDLLFK